ncbi:MAG: TnpV protein [Blautia faecis]
MVQEQAELQFDVLVEQMAQREGVTEQLKEENQMLWVQRMNNIRARSRGDCKSLLDFSHLDAIFLYGLFIKFNFVV